MKNETFKLRTEWTEAEISVGADIFISNEDARAILELTDIKRNPSGVEERAYDQVLMESRDFLREIAKRVLYISGKATSKEDLVSKFITAKEY